MLNFKNLIKIVVAQVLTIAIVLAFIETAGQLYARFNPGYETLYAIPDSMVGWRLAPKLKHIYTGGHWYAREFSVDIEHNALGFRDFNWDNTKPINTKRIALLGDSSVAAMEVEFRKTPGQILQQLLDNHRQINKKYEVMNFGIGGIGIGQSFLVYRQYAQAFDPDYVFLFIFEGNIYRTVGTLSSITNTVNTNQNLPIRPVFNISTKNRENNLVSLLEILNFGDFSQLLIKLKAQKIDPGKNSFPTEDEYKKLTNFFKKRITNEKITQLSEKLNKLELQLFLPKQKFSEEFARLQRERIETELGEDRTKIRERKLFLGDLWQKLQFGLGRFNGMFETEFAMKEEFKKLIKNYAPINKKDIFSGSKGLPNFEKVVFINLKILETLNRDIVNEGKKFIIVDASSHLIKYGQLPAKLLSTILNKYCEVNGIGYIPLHKPLDESIQQGLKTTWITDGHFNENGYRIFGEAMSHWIEEEEKK